MGLDSSNAPAAKTLGRLLSVAASRRMRGDSSAQVRISDLMDNASGGQESEVDKRLLAYDTDADGFLNKEELRSAVRGELDAIRTANVEASRRRQLMWVLIALLVVLLGAIAANTGLTYAVVRASQQTSTSSNDPHLRVKNSDAVVRTASADFTVRDGTLVPRLDDGDERVGSQGSAGSMKTADALVSGSFHSELPMSTLQEVRWINVVSESSGAELSVAVHAVLKRARDVAVSSDAATGHLVQASSQPCLVS